MEPAGYNSGKTGSFLNKTVLETSLHRFLIGLLVLTLIFAAPGTIQAQSEVVIDDLQVKIWPEYDQPSVLVINNIFLSGNVKLPVKLNFNIPKQVGSPHSVAVRELDGQLYLLDYEMTASGNWNQLTFTTPYPEIWIEYYDPSLEIKDTQRTFEYQWQGEYLVNNFSFEVQQPPTASNMNFKESMGQARIGNDGLTYFVMNVGEIKPNAKITLTMEYTKTSDQLTMGSAIPVEPASPLDTSTRTMKTSIITFLPLIIAAIGLFILIVGVLWYLSRQKTLFPPGQQHHPGKKVSPAYEEEGIYCHRCGKRANSGDVFCRACGTKLKIS